MLENIFISSILWREIFTKYRILVFPFNTLKMLFYCLLMWLILDETSAHILIFVPLFIICLFFSITAFKIISLSLVFEQFNSMMWFASPFFCFTFFGFPGFVVFTKFGKTSASIFQNFFCPLPPPPNSVTAIDVYQAVGMCPVTH